ncbi:type I asparaginase [Salinibacter altiplanensis]|uniref:type I asparaginase n=1 Tax=Salinibacter altiplanensis TaxID=1803181 RepID=UPI000C9ED185|nr:type I asparaginase [Salinibacter altiplanensis]
MAESLPRILVVYTGGTLGMVESEEGYVPGPGTLEALMEERLSFQSEDLPAYDVHALDPLLDSANMTPADWLRIAEVIRDHFEAYDGFLVVHGTDTMAFTASALAFMLQPLDKPVFLTGAQLPLDETRTDAQGNLLTSLLLLGTHADRMGGVHVFFHNRLYRGPRVTKVNADAFSAFDSPNFPAVGTAGIDLDVEWERMPAPHHPPRTPVVTELGAATVSAFRLFPGLGVASLKNVLAPPVQGVVLECFGAGNAPAQNEAFLDALRTATDRGVVIVAVTQPLRGTADLDLYATGQALANVGVVSGYDMTTEAALAKLYYLFEQDHAPDEVRRLVQRNLRGELTPPDEVPPALGRTRRRLAGYR